MRHEFINELIDDCAARSIVVVLDCCFSGVAAVKGADPATQLSGYGRFVHTPVSLGRDDAVVQFTHPDDSPRRIYLTGRLAARYKETVTASPWPTNGRRKKMPASGAWRTP